VKLCEVFAFFTEIVGKTLCFLIEMYYLCNNYLQQVYLTTIKILIMKKELLGMLAFAGMLLFTPPPPYGWGANRV